MGDKAKKKNRTWLYWLLIPCLLPLLYVLSIGPFLKVVVLLGLERNKTVVNAYRNIYGPLFDQNLQETILEPYVRFWLNDDEEKRLRL